MIEVSEPLNGYAETTDPRALDAVKRARRVKCLERAAADALAKMHATP